MDESSHTEAEQFTICGLTVVSADAVPDIQKKIEKIRKIYKFQEYQPLKWTLPAGWNRTEHGDAHRVAKGTILDLYSSSQVNYFCYLHLNHDAEANDSRRNATFGFNTLLGGFDRWLREKNGKGIVIFDRMDWPGAYDYCVEKYCKGLTFSDGRTSRLSNIISMSMASSRMSDLCSLNDVMTGAVQYIANGNNAISIRKSLVAKLVPALPRNKKGNFREHSFFMRPRDRSTYNQETKLRYDELRSFLNNSLV